MPIKLPDFRKSYVESIIACGQLLPEDSVFDDILTNKPIEIHYEYKSGRSRAYVMAVVSRGNRGKHFHLEALRKRGRQGEIPPGKAVELSELHEVIDQVIGHQASVKVTCGFRVPLERLPEKGLVRQHALRLSVEGVTLRTTAVELEVVGSLITRVSWRLLDKGKNVGIILDSHLQGTIEENYLNEFIDFMDLTFNSMIIKISGRDILGGGNASDTD